MHAELPFVAILVTLFLVGACAHSVRRGKATIAALCAWLAVTTFIFAVDAIVWASKVTTFIPVWCDLTSKFLTSAQLAFPACCLCICIERYGQLKPPEERRLPPSIRTANIVRYLLVAAVPLLYAALSCVVQVRRYDIIEDIGCRSAYITAIPTLFIVSLPPVLLCIGTAMLSLIIVCSFRRPRPSNPTLSRERQDVLERRNDVYLAGIVSAWLLVVGVIQAIAMIEEGLQSWPGLSGVHAALSKIATFSAATSSSSQRALAFFEWWAVPIASAIVLAFSFPFDKVWALLEIQPYARTGHRSRGSATGQTTVGSVASDDTAVSSSSNGTIRFGPEAHEVFNVPFATKGQVRAEDPEAVAVRPEAPRKPSLPSFLPIAEEDEDDGPRKDSAGALSVFTTSEFPLPPGLAAPAPPPPSPSALSPLPSSRASVFPGRLARQRSFPVSVASGRTDSALRHLSISSAFVDDAGQQVRAGAVPPVPVPALPRPPPAAEPARARFGLPFFDRRARAAPPPSGEYELQLSPAGLDAPENGEVYFMVPVKH